MQLFAVYVFQENFNIIAEPGSVFSCRDSCFVRTYSVFLPFLCECYFSFPFHSVFFHIWDLWYNNSKFILAMLHLLFQVFTKVSSKVNTKFISYNALCWWSVHVLPFHQTIINRLWSIGYLAPVLKSFAFKFWLFCCISWLHFPMVLRFVSTNLTNNL